MGKKALLATIKETNEKLNQTRRLMNSAESPEALDAYKEQIMELSLTLKQAKDDLKKWYQKKQS